MKQKKIWLTIVLLLVVAALGVGMYFVYRHFSPKAQTGEKHVTLTLVDDTGRAQTFEVDTDAQYLLEVLDAVADIEGVESVEFGYTLYTVNGVSADFTKDSAYWAVYVGEEYGIYNISDQLVEDGGRYTIQYETY